MENNYYFNPTYEVTPLTMAVLVHRDESGKVSARILEEQDEFIVRQSPTKIIDYACKFFGASLKG